MRGKRLCSLIFAATSRITPADAGKTRCWAASRVSLRDHPRGCGENRESLNYATRDIGSPPRMRGKHSFSLVAVVTERITPADAGKTQHGRKRRRNHEDHPRGCGENAPHRQAVLREAGSPPRMRGKPSRAAYKPFMARITPADAGKTIRRKAKWER